MTIRTCYHYGACALAWILKQGSILSPVLFLLVMNPLLISQQSGICLSLNVFFAGGSLHAALLMTSKVSTSIASTGIYSFWLCKKEVPQSEYSGSVRSFYSAMIPPGLVKVCLLLMGYRWCLLVCNCFISKSIEKIIKKARRAFFSYSSVGALRGTLNLSSKYIIDSCVLATYFCL